MALSSKKQIPEKKTAANNREGLVPIRFSIDASLYAFLEDIAKCSGKRVSAIISMYLTAAVDKNTKIEPCVARAMQQIVAEDIIQRFGSLLRLLSPEQVKNKIPN